MIRWKTWPDFPLFLLLAALPLLPARGQDLDHYFELAYDGNVDEVSAALPQLYRQHPNNGGVLFLEGLVTESGEAAVELYRKVVKLYPASPYADDAILKIGEYLYARGLYVQAANQLKKIPIYYPRSELIYPSIRLFLNALTAAGHQDTALFYAQVFSRKYPELEFDLEAGRAARGPGDEAAIATELAGESPVEPPSPATQQTTEPTRFRLQVGAFSVQTNAERQRALLESLNYRVIIQRRVSGGRTLHAVLVEGFTSRSEAESAGEELKRNYGLDYIVVPAD